MYELYIFKIFLKYLGASPTEPRNIDKCLYINISGISRVNVLNTPNFAGFPRNGKLNRQKVCVGEEADDQTLSNSTAENINV